MIFKFLASTSIHLKFDTFHLFCFENSSISSSKDLYKGLSFNLSLNSITSHTFKEIEGISTFIQFNLKCA